MTGTDIDALVFTPATERLPPLIPLIAQDARTGEVLMVGWANREALERTLDERRLWFFSRSRGRLWMKGETSGNVLRLESIVADCDSDTLLALVRPEGPACHTGDRSCFPAAPTLRALADVIAERLSDDAQATRGTSYTARLGADRNLRLKKLGEEATELALACADAERDGDGTGSVAAEAADLLYHAMVACASAGVGIDGVLDALESRLDRSGSASAPATSRARSISSRS